MSQADRVKWDTLHGQCAGSVRRPPTMLLQTWIDQIPHGRALDVACGAGRNAVYLAGQGFAVDAVDISREALRRGRALALQRGVMVNWIEHDLDHPLTLTGEYALILIVRYVDLTLADRLIHMLVPGGFLLCEQHLMVDAEVSGPANPAYRVRPGALKALATGLDIQFDEETLARDPDGSQVALARLVAQAPP